MIRKKDLLDAVDCLTVQIARQGQLIRELQREVDTLKEGKKAPLSLDKKRLQKAAKGVAKDAPKRGRGRPRKNA